MKRQRPPACVNHIPFFIVAVSLLYFQPTYVYFETFCGHLGPHLTSTRQIHLHLGPTWLTSAQLGHNLDPLWSHLGPNLGQLGSNLSPTWPNFANLSSTWRYIGPTGSQIAQQLDQFGSNLGPICCHVISGTLLKRHSKVISTSIQKICRRRLDPPGRLEPPGLSP